MEVGKQFQDKAHIIYVNGENTDDSPLGRLMQDFKQSDADKMHSKLLSDRMKYLKSTDEEVTKMCNIVEEYSAKSFDQSGFSASKTFSMAIIILPVISA